MTALARWEEEVIINSLLAAPQAGILLYSQTTTISARLFLYLHLSRCAAAGRRLHLKQYAGSINIKRI